ncbi:hypothetical protein [Psychrobacter sp. JCM 18901]|nr:hypothetical protein [Psychrobacter sp. JCM 18901]
MAGLLSISEPDATQPTDVATQPDTINSDFFGQSSHRRNSN